jgi:Zn-dependent protease with chaperone function
VPRDSAGATSDVPAQLRAEYEQIAARAAAAGRPLRPVPLLELTADARHGSRAILGPPGGADLPRVRLSVNVLTTAPAERAWTIAHELSHVLHRQEDARPGRTTGFLAGAAGIAGGTVAAVLGAVYSVLLGSGVDVGPLLTLALLGVGALWLMLVALIRREETAADVTAAAVFGEVLTFAGVERLRRGEGALARYVPNVLREHNHLSDRRRAGLATIGRASNPED